MRRASQFFAVLLAISTVVMAPWVAKGQGNPDPIADVVAKVSPAVVRIITVRAPAHEDVRSDAKLASASGSDAKMASASASANGPAPTSPPAPDNGSESDRTTTATGSGFIIDPAGFIATNKHVVDGATSVFVVTSDGVRYVASFVGMPGKSDMALIRIHSRAKFPSVAFGDSDKVRVGDPVIAIGSPFGFDNSVTSGIISAVNRDIMESPFDDYLQTDAAINHGNSGGPLFNMVGEVIGMNSVIFSPSTGSSGLGFAIPSNELQFVFDRLMKTGMIKAGMLPIHTQQVSWMLKQALDAPDLQGALVIDVEDSGEKMLHGKIKAGDVIRTFNGEKVWDPRDLARKAAQAPIGSNAALEIYRKGVLETVDVTIHEWPPAPPVVLQDGGQQSLGLQLASATGPDGRPMVTVASVDPNGSAADSGIQKGDIILEVQQTPVSDPDQALRIFEVQTSMDQRFAAVLVERDKKRSWMPLAVPY